MSSRSGAPSRAAAWALYAGVCALVLAAWHRMLDLELLGWDSYPLIAAGRVRTLAELAGTFGEELMDGRYPLGHYYRPVVHLSFALDHWLWALEPRGYHLTDLVLLALCACACAALARRALGGGAVALAGAAVAGVVYALHAVHFDILPAPPRRAESLAVLFTLLALYVQLGAPPAMSSFTRRVAVASLCVLAVGSKETGAIAAAAVACAAWLASRSGPRGASPDLGPRIAATARALWPTAALFALYLLARRSVLGGLGGTSSTTFAPDAGKLGPLALGQLQAMLVPEAPLGELGLARWAALGGAALLAVLLVAGLRRLRPQAHAPMSAPAAGLLLLGWSVLLLWITSLAGVERAWYGLPFLPILALALGALATTGLDALRSRAPVLGTLAWSAVALAAAAGLSAGGLFARAPELEAGSREMRAWLARFDRAVEEARPGERLLVPGLPIERPPQPGTSERRRVVLLAPYSVEAYAQLRHPLRPVRIVGGGGGPRRDVIVVELVP